MKRLFSDPRDDDDDEGPRKRARIEGCAVEVPWATGLHQELLMRIAYALTDGRLFYIGGEGASAILAVPALEQAKRPILRENHSMLSVKPKTHQHIWEKRTTSRIGEAELRRLFLLVARNLGLVCKTWFALIDWTRIARGIAGQLKGVLVGRLRDFLPEEIELNDAYTRSCLTLALADAKRRIVDADSGIYRAKHWPLIGKTICTAKHSLSTVAEMPVGGYLEQGTWPRRSDYKSLVEFAGQIDEKDARQLRDGHDLNGKEITDKLYIDGKKYTSSASAFRTKYPCIQAMCVLHRVWDYDAHHWRRPNDNQFTVARLHELLERYAKSERHHKDMVALYKTRK